MGHSRKGKGELKKTMCHTTVQNILKQANTCAYGTVVSVFLLITAFGSK